MQLVAHPSRQRRAIVGIPCSPVAAEQRPDSVGKMAGVRQVSLTDRGTGTDRTSLRPVPGGNSGGHVVGKRTVSRSRLLDGRELGLREIQERVKALRLDV